MSAVTKTGVSARAAAVVNDGAGGACVGARARTVATPQRRASA